jgi:hypothetical protein
MSYIAVALAIVAGQHYMSLSNGWWIAYIVAILIECIIGWIKPTDLQIKRGLDIYRN